jgi:(1->4)-alpha-D-glucan 1-alpha-D-glucosylmutase
VTGPVMAKGLEDTTFYVYNRLISLNEVGGEPEVFGVPLEVFHRNNTWRAKRFPASMLASSTHDTKRSEDVRARIDVLSELPDTWDRFVTVAREANASRKVMVGGKPAPDAAEEVLFYQTLLGAAPEWPIPAAERDSFRDRLIAYMQKATKEAKVNNSWTNHRPEYDEAVTKFVTAVLAVPEDDPFFEEMRRLHRRVARVGKINAVSQQLIKIACPGVPDIYQGTEVVDLSLVDPDNRRPVDYRARAEKLAALERSDESTIKLFVTHRALQARRRDPELFRDGTYIPLDVVGPRARHVVAFARLRENRLAICVAPRLCAAIVGDRDAWNDTYVTLPDEVAEQIQGGVLRDVFTESSRRAIPREGGPALAVPELFADFPLSLLTREAS